MCGSGASSTQQELQAEQTQFYQLLQNAWGTQFANQQNVLNQITSYAKPIFAQGPNVNVFQTPQGRAMGAALNTSATQAISNAYGNQQRALGEEQAAAAGNSFVPSGSNLAQQQQISSQESANIAQTTGQTIPELGYSLGQQQWQEAANLLGSVASQDNPLGWAGAATNAGSLASNTASQVQQANAAASPFGALGGLVGGVAGSFLGPVGASLGSSLGSSLGGGSNIGSSLFSLGGGGTGAVPVSTSAFPNQI